MLPVNVRRTYRASDAGNVTVTVLPDAGSNRYPADASSVWNVLPSVLPSTESVCVRAAHAVAGGSCSTSRDTLLDAPRSTVIDCGNAPSGLSQ